jgi:hypothetical protein
MDLELREDLTTLRDSVGNFIENLDAVEINEDLEYTFLEDESGISNTKLDNLVETLQHVVVLVDGLITK